MSCKQYGFVSCSILHDHRVPFTNQMTDQHLCSPLLHGNIETRYCTQQAGGLPKPSTATCFTPQLQYPPDSEWVSLQLLLTRSAVDVRLIMMTMEAFTSCQ
jgi:hypothetical protein